MTPKEVQDHISAQNISLAAKGTLLLTVTLETEEQAEEIMRWMYGKEKPMKATLVKIDWDSVPMPEALAAAVRVLRNT